MNYKDAKRATGSHKPDGLYISFAVPLEHGGESNVHLNGDAAKKALRELRKNGVVVHFEDGSCSHPHD